MRTQQTRKPSLEPSEPCEPDTPAVGSRCDPNYSGACPRPNVSDYDCRAGGDRPYFTGPVTGNATTRTASMPTRTAKAASSASCRPARTKASPVAKLGVRAREAIDAADLHGRYRLPPTVFARIHNAKHQTSAPKRSGAGASRAVRCRVAALPACETPARLRRREARLGVATGTAGCSAFGRRSPVNQARAIGAFTGVGTRPFTGQRVAAPFPNCVRCGALGRAVRDGAGS